MTVALPWTSRSPGSGGTTARISAVRRGQAGRGSVRGKTDVFLAVVPNEPADERVLVGRSHSYRGSMNHATASLRTARTWLAQAMLAGASPQPEI